MVSVNFDDSKTGWLMLPGNLGRIVAHFKDGHTEELDFAGLVTLPKRTRLNIVRLDCYGKDEK